MKYIGVLLTSELYERFLDVVYLWHTELSETLEKCIEYECEHYQEMKRLSFNKFKTKDKVPKDYQKTFKLDDKRYNQLLELAKKENLPKSTLLRKMIVYLTNQIDGIEIENRDKKISDRFKRDN
jgi:hypothetical protein